MWISMENLIVLKLYKNHFCSHEFYVLLASKDRLYAVFIIIYSSLFLAVHKIMCNKREKCYLSDMPFRRKIQIH